MGFIAFIPYAKKKILRHLMTAYFLFYAKNSLIIDNQKVGLLS